MRKQEAAGAGGGSEATVAERECPKCAGKLVKRTSKFGPFYGCSNYPKCRHIDRS